MNTYAGIYTDLEKSQKQIFLFETKYGKPQAIQNLRFQASANFQNWVEDKIVQVEEWTEPNEYPAAVQTILDSYGDEGPETYQECQECQNKLLDVGVLSEFGLDGNIIILKIIE